MRKFREENQGLQHEMEKMRNKLGQQQQNDKMAEEEQGRKKKKNNNKEDEPVPIKKKRNLSRNRHIFKKDHNDMDEEVVDDDDDEEEKEKDDNDYEEEKPKHDTDKQGAVVVGSLAKFEEENNCRYVPHYLIVYWNWPQYLQEEENNLKDMRACGKELAKMPPLCYNKPNVCRRVC